MCESKYIEQNNPLIKNQYASVMIPGSYFIIIRKVISDSDTNILINVVSINNTCITGIKNFLSPDGLYGTDKIYKQSDIVPTLSLTKCSQFSNSQAYKIKEHPGNVIFTRTNVEELNRIYKSKRLKISRCSKSHIRNNVIIRVNIKDPYGNLSYNEGVHIIPFNISESQLLKSDKLEIDINTYSCYCPSVGLTLRILEGVNSIRLPIEIFKKSSLLSCINMKQYTKLNKGFRCEYKQKAW